MDGPAKTENRRIDGLICNNKWKRANMAVLYAEFVKLISSMPRLCFRPTTLVGEARVSNRFRHNLDLFWKHNLQVCYIVPGMGLIGEVFLLGIFDYAHTVFSYPWSLLPGR